MSYTELNCYIDYQSYSFRNYEQVRKIIKSKINEICRGENDLILNLQESGGVLVKTEIILK